MEKDNAQSRRYLREVRSWLPCGGKLKQRALGEIRAMVAGFLRENPDAGYADIAARFGAPQQIAASYVDEMETEELLYRLRIRNRIVRSVMAALIIALLLWLGQVSLAYMEALNQINGTMTEQIVILDRIEEG